MDEQPTYTNRELYLLIKGNSETNLLQHKAIQDSLMEFHNSTNKTLEAILAQTSKTNGRVNGLELWQSYVKGSVWIVPIIVSALVTGGVALLFNFFK